MIAIECPACRRQEGETNHPRGMIFVGWGRGWEPCSRCGGSAQIEACPACGEADCMCALHAPGKDD